MVNHTHAICGFLGDIARCGFARLRLIPATAGPVAAKAQGEFWHVDCKAAVRGPARGLPQK
jgi:hypothetical protein